MSAPRHEQRAAQGPKPCQQGLDPMNPMPRSCKIALAPSDAAIICSARLLRAFKLPLSARPVGLQFTLRLHVATMCIVVVQPNVSANCASALDLLDGRLCRTSLKLGQLTHHAGVSNANANAASRLLSTFEVPAGKVQHTLLPWAGHFAMQTDPCATHRHADVEQCKC